MCIRDRANLRNVTTEFQAGGLADIATLPPTNPIARQKGAQALTPEESVNITLGAIFDLGDLSVTLDYYNIEIEDRIAFTSRFDITEEDITALLAAGVSDATSFSSVRFFSNQQSVEVSGIDLVASYPFDLAGGSSSLTVVGSWSDIELTEFNPDFTDENTRLQIEDGRPDFRLTATWTHLRGPWRFMVRARYYGEHYDAPANVGAWSFYPDPSVLVDAEVSWDIREDLSLLVGAQNVFDEYPSANPISDAGDGIGLIYPEQSPYGFNGGFYYFRATWRPAF